MRNHAHQLDIRDSVQLRILVTGGSGFIGKNLVCELREHGHVVHNADTAAPDVRDRIDVSSQQRISTLLQDLKPDLVFHLAAEVGRVLCEDDVASTIKTNALMTANIAIACAEHGVRLAYVSTSEIYGDHGDTAVDENTLTKLPHNLYGLSKRWGEEVAQLYAPKNLIIIRPSMPYGPGAPTGRGRRAIDNMLWQAIHRKPIIVHRGATRSWCWIGDLVRGMRLAVEQPDPRVFNIGRDDDMRTMMEIARLACDMADAPYDLIEEVDPPRNVTPVKNLSTAAIRELGWEPSVDLDVGLPALFEWISRFDADGELVDTRACSPNSYAKETQWKDTP
jgi:UDP-glucose 4-epimerase